MIVGGGGGGGKQGGGRLREAREEEREAGFLRCREAEEKGKNYATLRNISQSKHAKRREPTNTGRETGLKGTGRGSLNPLSPPPHDSPVLIL